MEGSTTSRLAKNFNPKPNIDNFIRTNQRINAKMQQNIFNHKKKSKLHNGQLHSFGTKYKNIQAKNICRDSKCSNDCDK